jgi:hypothetical protein
MNIIGGIGGGCYTMIGNYMIGELHYLQEDTVPVNFFGRVCLVLGAGLSACLLPRLGPWKMFMLGALFSALGPFCFVMFGHWARTLRKQRAASPPRCGRRLRSCTSEPSYSPAI